MIEVYTRFRILESFANLRTFENFPVKGASKSNSCVVQHIHPRFNADNVPRPTLEKDFTDRLRLAGGHYDYIEFLLLPLNQFA